MNKSTSRKKAIISGIGSLLAIFPSTNYDMYVPKKSDGDRIKSHWEQTGSHLRAAMGKYEQENKQK